MSKRFSQEQIDSLFEKWLFLTHLKSGVGVLLLVVGGTLSFALAGMPFVAGVIVPCFWLSGIFLIMKLNLTIKVESSKEVDESKWSELLLEAGKNENY